MRWEVAGILSLGLALMLACSGPFGTTPIEISKELSPEQIAKADQLAGLVVEGTFPAEASAACAENALFFAWLAARSDDPLVVIASLRAGAVCSQDPAADPGISSDLARAVAHHLADSDPTVVLAAFAAADALVAPLPPDHPLVYALIEAASSPRPEVRYEALIVLDRRTWATEPLVALSFLHALQINDAPWLVTEVLRRLRYRASGLVDAEGTTQASFRSAGLVLTQDLDPGIRGRAALMLARLAPKDEDVIGALMRLLDDPHGFVRSAAAEALAEADHREAIAAILSRIDDPARNTWDMLPFDRLDGTREVPHHVGSLFERVDDAYLRALVVLSSSMGDNAFVYREISLRYRDLDIIAATRDAKQWYAKIAP